jgi:hypothetical protein
VYLLTAKEATGSGHLYRYPTAATPTPVLDLYLNQQALSPTGSGGVLVSDTNGIATSVFRKSVDQPDPGQSQALELGEAWVSAGFGSDGALVTMTLDGDVGVRPTPSSAPRSFFRAPPGERRQQTDHGRD